MSSNPVVPGFKSIIGQQFPLRILRRFLDRAAVPHALLFTGIEGIGKRTSARIFAMALNCRAAPRAAAGNRDAATDRPCGRCRSCRQIQNGSHPDVIQVAPEKGILRIGQIREVLATLAMKPFSAEDRVVIISDAQTLNPEAGNALLKALEEPPDDTILILTALQQSDLLPTIVSRCRHIRFSPLHSRDLALLLADTRGLDAQQAETIAEAAGGSYTKALALAGAHWSDQRDWIIGAAGLDRADRSIHRSAAPALAFAANLAQGKEEIAARLEVLQTWIRDLSVWPYVPGHIINKDRRETLQAARVGLTGQQLLGLWEAVEQAQKDIAANGNLRLTLDVMALRMASLLAA